jgi:hypothetical protein
MDEAGIEPGSPAEFAAVAKVLDRRPASTRGAVSRDASGARARKGPIPLLAKRVYRCAFCRPPEDLTYTRWARRSGPDRCNANRS